MKPEDYALSAAELDRIFSNFIVPTLFRRAERSDSPVLILLGAQPGAGKTRAGATVSAASGQKVTAIVGDDLRSYHPSYDFLLNQSPADMPDATAQASSGWVERSIEFAAERGISVLVEGTFRNPAVPIETARKFKSKGFSVQAVVVVVAPEVSRASIAGRFVEDAMQDGHARFTSVQAHNYAFRMIPFTLAELAATSSPVDRLTLRNRTKVLFDKNRVGAAAIRGALSVAKSEWDAPLGEANTTTQIALLDRSLSYLTLNLTDNAEAQELVRQLVLDHEYFNLSRSGDVAVRGHLRGGGDVKPHLRAHPVSRIHN